MLYICLGLLVAGILGGAAWWIIQRRRTGKPVGYGPYFAGWFLTWPIISYMGAQGFSGLVAFLALPVILFTRPKSMPPYLLALIAFVAWAIFSATWSAAGEPAISGNLADGTFAINATGLRISLTILAISGVLMALSHMQQNTTQSARLVRWTALVVGCGVCATAVFQDHVLDLVASLSDAREMGQNMMRNANAFLLLFPLLIACFWVTGKQWHQLGVVISIPIVAAAQILTGSASALLAIGLMLLFMGFVSVAKKRGMAVLLIGTAIYGLLSPIILGGVVWVSRTFSLPIANSFWSRIHAWEFANKKIAESPLIGHGLEASETWSDTFGEHPDRLVQIIADSGEISNWQVYPIVPRHPHNMPLQIWVETGLIGVSLAAGALFLLAWRLRDIGHWSSFTRMSVAGLFGTVLSFYSLSYSVWNEAFWASVAIAVGAIILHAKSESNRV